MIGPAINSIIKDFQYLLTHVSNKECQERMTFGFLASLLDPDSKLSDEEIAKILNGLNKDTRGSFKGCAQHALTRLVSDLERSGKQTLPRDLWNRKDFVRDVIDSL